MSAALTWSAACKPAAPRSEVASPARPLDPARYPQIENFVVVTNDLFSGAQPLRDAHFDALASAGVRTVISVDGAVPDAASARARGMRYVHLPIGYDGIEAPMRVELARALRDLPKPIYVHCHHGKHRGPAAAAVAAVCAGQVSTAEGRALLERVGTSPSYTGLWAAVDESRALPDAVMDTAPAEFPERARVADFTAAMAIVDRAFDHLKLIREAGWQTPADHPDLVPLSEAGQLADALAPLPDDVFTRNKPADFREMMQESATQAEALRAALRDCDFVECEKAMAALTHSCKQCHQGYRD